MKALHYNEFRRNVTKILDRVTNEKEVAIVLRDNGKNVAIMDLDEYNSIAETLYVKGNEINRERLQEAIDEMNNGVYYSHKLMED